MDDPLDTEYLDDDRRPVQVRPPASSPTRPRYMRRSRRRGDDRNGDPLAGMVNLWDIALVLAVAFLLASLTAIGLGGLLTANDLTVVTNPGQPNMQVIQKKGSQITTYDVQSGQTAAGGGTLIGEFYRLADGTVVYVPTGATPSPGVTGYPTAAPTTAPYVTPTPGVFSPSPTTSPYPYSTLTPAATTPPAGTIPLP